ncbi:MAG: hypothetical protein HFF19_07985 [Oscillospiraceae bacterium]|jgi:hypothetical protein|nr:hypothetical protein [Oscillospiraceae bacterium]
MAFVSLFFIFLLWPVWIVMIALAFLLPWLGMALTTVAAILLACNAGFLALLLFIRAKWKATGRMDKGYISGFDGWKRYGLLSVKVLLTAGVIWEAVVVLVCALLLIFQPWNAILR